MIYLLSNIKKALFLTLWLTIFGLAFLVLTPQKVGAAWDGTTFWGDNFGWLRTRAGPPVSVNTVTYNFYDAHTKAPLSADYFNVNVGPYAISTYKETFCDTACPVSVTISDFPNNDNIGVGIFFQKGGYNYISNGLAPPYPFTGATSRIYDVYVTLSSDPFTDRVSVTNYYPWPYINYVPTATFTASHNPSFDTGASSLTMAPWTHYASFSQTSGPPFPATFNYTHPANSPDGYIYLFTHQSDNSSAYSGGTGISQIKDTVAPTVTCGLTSTPSPMGVVFNLHVTAIDALGATGVDSAGVDNGTIEQSTDGGANWTAATTIDTSLYDRTKGGFYIDQTVQINGEFGKTYLFRWRAKDRTFNILGVSSNQYSSYCTTPPAATPPVPKSYSLSWGGVSNPSVNPGGSVDFSIQVTPQCSPAWVGDLDVTIANPAITPNDGKISSALSPSSSGFPSTTVSINCSSGSKTIVYTLTANSSATPGSVYNPVRFTATSSAGNKSIDGSLTINNTSVNQWLQTTLGDVYSGGGFSLNPPQSGYTSDYLLRIASGSLGNATSNPNKTGSSFGWTITGSPDTGTVVSYSTFFSQAGGSNIRTLDCSSGNADTINSAPDDVRLCNGSVTISSAGSNSTSAVIFVNGDLTIDADLNYSGVVFFVVKDNIKIKSSVTNINAFLYSDKEIDSSYDVNP